MRVFVGPVEIAGHYSQLAAALRELGVDAVSVDLSGHPFRYASDQPESVWIRLATWAAVRSRQSRGQFLPLRAAWRAFEIAARIPLLIWSLGRFDAFVFGFGETLLYRLELPLLRLIGKHMIFVFNGSDARPSYVDGADMAASLNRTTDDCIRMTRRKKSRIRRIEHYADAIVSQPAFSHFFERPVVDFFKMGVSSVHHGSHVVGRRKRGEIRILHSPSHPEVKGSARIREAVQNLRAEGLHLTLVELRGVPNETVRTEIARSDFVIDQIYSDAPMVSFATEAASAGIPAIVGGYAWPELRRIYPDDAMPPVEQCHPDDLESAIRRLATDEEHRLALGRRARAFVEGTWAPRLIAERYMALLRARPAESMMFDPRTLRYLGGVGLTDERARALVAAVLARGGREALQLADKPTLEDAFVRFAEGPPSN